jgi:hypothetical protein
VHALCEDKVENIGGGAEAFYNKSPGQYTFKVMAVATNGSWTSGEQVLDLLIDKPLHKQTWFIVEVLLLVSGIILAISRYRFQKQRLVLGL